jgi:hypothetical protein
LYAGDLNLMQDLAAALTDLVQVISTGSLKVGEDQLQLLRYGALEARLTGALRVDGIVRALGGFYGGAFTTAQRDAIPSGSHPYGLVILNTTVNTYQWNSGSDATPSWTNLGVAAGSVPGHHITHEPGGSDTLDWTKFVRIGAYGTIGSPGGNNTGTWFIATDQANTMYFSNGVSWILVSKGSLATAQTRYTLSEWPPVAPTDGMQVILFIDNAHQWHFKYDAAISDAYKWIFLGGNPLRENNTFVGNSVNSTSYGNFTSPTTIQALVSGIWDIQFGSAHIHGAGPDSDAWLGVAYDSAGPRDNEAIRTQDTKVKSGWFELNGIEIVSGFNVTIKGKVANASTSLRTNNQRLILVPDRIS